MATHMLGHKAEAFTLKFQHNNLGTGSTVEPFAITWADDELPPGSTLGVRSKVVSDLSKHFHKISFV